MEKKIVLDENGNVTCLYGDDLPSFGAVKNVRRASHVEWGLVPGSCGWDVQLADEPFNGPYAGRVLVSKHVALPVEKVRCLVLRGLYDGFESRQQALETEVAFLQRYVLGRYDHGGQGQG